MTTDRQYGPIERIRRDHVERYLFAAERLAGAERVLDLACGCGYGSWLLQAVAQNVIGVDCCEEAIRYAGIHYPGPTYLCQKAEDTAGHWGAMVSFETLEHLKDPLSVLRENKAEILIASVPNEECVPFCAQNFERDEYPHQRHYTPRQFRELLQDAGYAVESEHCQKGKKDGVEPGTDGDFLVYVAIPK